MIVCTVPWTINKHIKNNICSLVDHGAVVTTVCNGNHEINGVTHINCSIQRKISIYYDLIAFINIFFIILIRRPDVIHTYSSKAGLLALPSAKILLIKRRIHTYTDCFQ